MRREQYYRKVFVRCHELVTALPVFFLTAEKKTSQPGTAVI
jgi:hypothetical protein